MTPSPSNDAVSMPRSFTQSPDWICKPGCWAHARRKFVEAQKVQPKGLAPEARQRLREQKRRPLIAQLHTWLDKSLTQVLPKSALGKALHYLDGQW